MPEVEQADSYLTGPYSNSLVGALKFRNKISMILLFAHHMLKILGAGSPMIVDDMGELARKLIFEIRTRSNKEQQQKIDNTFEEAISDIKKSWETKVQSYESIILNQSLVLFCSTFDTYLGHLFELVLINRPETLKAGKEKSITLEEILTLSDHAAILGYFREKELKSFMWTDIGKRIEVFENRFGIDVKAIFRWNGYDSRIKAMLAGKDLNTLHRIYNHRHAIVHKDEASINSFSELECILKFLSCLGTSLGFMVSEHFKIDLDLIEFLVKFGSPPAAIRTD